MAATLAVHPGVVITAHPALWLPDEQLVAVADLHLGYEASLGRRGAYLPGGKAASSRDRLLALLDELQPTRLLLLGDLKHSTRGADANEQAEVRAVLAALTARVEVLLLRGNHDKGLERIAAVPMADTYEAGGWTFAHGDKFIDAERVIVGHEHPAFTVADGVGAGFRAPCFLVGTISIVLPAWNRYAAGSDVLRVPPGGFLSPYTRCEEQRCYAVEGGRLFVVSVLPPLR
jgi:uncharacterized protein